MRDICNVIDQLLTVIPASETKLRAELTKTRQSAIYCAPELQKNNWIRATNSLVDATGDRDDEWVLKTVRIFNGEESVEIAPAPVARDEPSDGIEF